MTLSWRQPVIFTGNLTSVLDVCVLNRYTLSSKTEADHRRHGTEEMCVCVYNRTRDSHAILSGPEGEAHTHVFGRKGDARLGVSPSARTDDRTAASELASKPLG